MIKAEIVAHSLNPQGDEVISVLCTFPRIILAEVNTHRMLSKNTSSSRAIPFEKMVEVVQNNPFIPIAWQKEHKGMQGSEYATYPDTEDFKSIWLEARDNAIKSAQLAQTGDVKLTKQLCNRLLEPFMWTTMLITGSRQGWDNFHSLRNPIYEYKGEIFNSKKDAIKSYTFEKGFEEDRKYLQSLSDLEWLQINKGQAEIHMMMLSEKIYDCIQESVPKQLKANEWHLPFEDSFNIDEMVKETYNPKYNGCNWLEDVKIKVSTAMAAHTSYTTVGNEPVKSYEKWIELHDKLIAYDPPHSSPMEHCARAMSGEEYQTFYKGKCYAEITMEEEISNQGWCYNLKGFISLRYFIDNSIKY